MYTAARCARRVCMGMKGAAERPGLARTGTLQTSPGARSPPSQDRTSAVSSRRGANPRCAHACPEHCNDPAPARGRPCPPRRTALPGCAGCHKKWPHCAPPAPAVRHRVAGLRRLPLEVAPLRPSGPYGAAHVMSLSGCVGGRQGGPSTPHRHMTRQALPVPSLATHVYLLCWQRSQFSKQTMAMSDLKLMCV